MFDSLHKHSKVLKLQYKKLLQKLMDLVFKCLEDAEEKNTTFPQSLIKYTCKSLELEIGLNTNIFRVPLCTVYIVRNGFREGGLRGATPPFPY